PCRAHDLQRSPRSPRHERPYRRDARRHPHRHPPRRHRCPHRDGRRARAGWKGGGVNKYFRELSVAAALGLLLLALAIFAPHFFSLHAMLSRLTAQTPALTTAIGMTLVIVSRQIDISIGSQCGMCAVIAGLLAAA